MNEFYVYIMANVSGMLYIGVTNDLLRRVFEHKAKQTPGFTQRYNMTMLVYFESTPSHIAAIEREKQLKRWRRQKKIMLIETINPKWLDLSKGWYSDGPGVKVTE